MTISGVDGPTCCSAPESSETIAAAFANTACADAGCSRGFHSFDELLAILAGFGAVDPTVAERLRATATPAEAAAALEAISRFRDTVVEALEALRTGGPVPQPVLDQINVVLATCGCKREVLREGDAYRIRIRFEIEKPADLLMPLANALSETLTWVDPTRVKQCREERCTCYFVDTSKNRTRTWCSMDRCGNRAKVAAYYARSKRTPAAI